MNGYTILKNSFPERTLEDLKHTIEELLFMQGKKLGIEIPLNFNNWKAHRAELNQVFEMLIVTRSGRECASFASTLLDKKYCILTGPSVRINFPNQTESLYTWHSEAHWYPKRRSFYNLWSPLYGPKHEGNGTMYIKPNTHSRQWHFREYTAGLLQYEVPEQEHRDFQEIPMILNEGDVVIFDRNLLHRSSLNKSNEPSLSLEFRAYDYTNDLTTSAKTGERPYQ